MLKFSSCIHAGVSLGLNPVRSQRPMLKDLFLDVLFPKFCLGCGKEGKYICERCDVFISECEPIEFTETRVSGELDGLISVWEYEGLIKKAIHQIKYQGITDIIKELMNIIEVVEVGSDPDLTPIITYVPMYKKREKKRGFNQAKIIARELAKKTGFPAVCLLKKIKDTKPQMELKQKERLENIKGCFKPAEARPRQNCRGRASVKSVILVDDVYTTGATMRECAKVLKKSGMEKVIGFVLARTV